MPGKTLGVAMLAAIALTGCSQKEERKVDPPKREGRVTITPPRMPTDPAALKTAQKDMVEQMIADTSLPLDMIEGEAYRRGVTLTGEQIARKKEQALRKTPAPANPPATDADGTYASTSPTAQNAVTTSIPVRDVAK